MLPTPSVPEHTRTAAQAARLCLGAAPGQHFVLVIETANGNHSESAVVSIEQRERRPTVNARSPGRHAQVQIQSDYHGCRCGKTLGVQLVAEGELVTPTVTG